MELWIKLDQSGENTEWSILASNRFAGNEIPTQKKKTTCDNCDLDQSNQANWIAPEYISWTKNDQSFWVGF